MQVVGNPLDFFSYWYQGAFSQNAGNLMAVQSQCATDIPKAMGPNADPAAVAAAIASCQAQSAYVYNQVQSGGVLPSDQPDPSGDFPWWMLAIGVGAVVVGVAVVK